MAAPFWRRIWSSSCDSAQLARCSLDAHLAFDHMAYVVDLYGACVATPAVIRAGMLKLRADVSDKMIEKWLVQWSREGLIIRHVDNGLPALQIVNFDRYQPEAVRYREECGIEQKIAYPPDFTPPPPLRKPRSDRGKRINGGSIADDDSAIYRQDTAAPCARENERSAPSARRTPSASRPYSPSNEDPISLRFQQLFPSAAQSHRDYEQFCVLRQQFGDRRVTAVFDSADALRARTGQVGFGFFVAELRKPVASAPAPPQPQIRPWTVTPEEAELLPSEHPLAQEAGRD